MTVGGIELLQWEASHLVVRIFKTAYVYVRHSGYIMWDLGWKLNGNRGEIFMGGV
jgi:hypothetical protein